MHKGHVTITRVQSNTEADFVEIRLTDDTSRTQVFSVKLGPMAFMMAILGDARQPAMFSIDDVGHIGMIRETKEIALDVSEPVIGGRAEHSRTLLEPYEIDGWVGRVDDLWNHHRRIRGNKAVVLFMRFKEIPDDN